MERIDSKGKWILQNGIEMLVEPSEEWLLEKQLVEPQPVPKTPLEILQEENATLQIKANELQEQLAQTNTDMQAFMDFIFTILIPE